MQPPLRYWLWPAILGWAVSVASAQEPESPTTLAKLQQQLNGHFLQPKYAAALWGVKIVSLDTAKTLYETNAQKLFSPASNSKLYTVALALDRLGPEFRIKTSLYSRARPDRRGTLKGDLIVYGRGDPTLNARLRGGDLLSAVQPLVFAVTNAGVKRITGDLVGDASFFRGPEFGSGWTWDDAESYYGAEISALTLNDNALSVTVNPGRKIGAPCEIALASTVPYLNFSNRTVTVEKGGRRALNFFRPLDQNVFYVSGQMAVDAPAYSEDLTVHNPAGLFVAVMREALARAGVKIRGQVRTVNWLQRPVSPLDYAQMVDLGSSESLPLREIVREVMKPSQNLYTDLLLAQVGEAARSKTDRADETSEELGIRELNRFLPGAGVKPGNVLFEEGSGLSRNNLTTPNATVALLQHMSRHACAQVYLDALPIAGVDGTLKNRMKATPAAGNVRAKTGTLRWANSLSGYVTTAAGEHLAFSLMLNRYHNTGGGGPARGDLDAIAVLLAGFTGRSE